MRKAKKCCINIFDFETLFQKVNETMKRDENSDESQSLIAIMKKYEVSMEKYEDFRFST